MTKTHHRLTQVYEPCDTIVSFLYSYIKYKNLYMVVTGGREISYTSFPKLFQLLEQILEQRRKMAILKNLS